MLMKAMKYNWMATYKIIVLLNLYVLITTCIAIGTLISGVWNQNSERTLALGTILFILYILSIAFVSSVAVIFLAVRYYRNMYSDEGYLIHTLPLTKHQLLISQTLVGTIHTLITTIIMLACIFLLTYFMFTCLDTSTQTALSIHYDPGFLADVNTAFEKHSVLKITEILLYLVFSSAHGILLAFAGVSLGQLFSKHKIVGAIVCYIGLYTMVQIATSVIILPFMGMSLFGNVTLTQLLDCGMLVETIFAFLCSAGFYFICYYMLSKKLNLD